MKIEISKVAISDLRTISDPHRKNIEKKIASLKNYPNVSNVKRLVDYDPPYRLRVGDYRVLFDMTEDTVFIGRVLHRKKAYK